MFFDGTVPSAVAPFLRAAMRSGSQFAVALRVAIVAILRRLVLWFVSRSAGILFVFRHDFLRLRSGKIGTKVATDISQMSQKIATIAAIAFVVFGCGRSGQVQRNQQQYQTVQEGSASGVTSTINAPGETTPPLTNTNVDTTTNFTLPTNPNPLGNDTAGGSMASAMPSYPAGTPGMTTTRPRTPARVTNAPVVTDTVGSTTPAMPRERVPREQHPQTQTDTAATDTTTTTPPTDTTMTDTSSTTSTSPSTDTKKKKDDGKKKDSGDQSQPTPPPPPTATDTRG